MGTELKKQNRGEKINELLLNKFQYLSSMITQDGRSKGQVKRIDQAEI